jgi:hypothetical protein
MISKQENQSTPGSPLQEKVTSPIRPEILYKECDLSDKRNMGVTLLLKPFLTVKNVKVKIRTIGTVTLLGQVEYEFKEILSNQQKEIPVRVCSEKNGTGGLIASVSAYDSSGNKLSDSLSELLFHISEEEVLAGQNGLMELELKHLEHLKEQGKITKKKYDEERKKILNGGAKIEIQIN